MLFIISIINALEAGNIAKIIPRPGLTSLAAEQTLEFCLNHPSMPVASKHSATVPSNSTPNLSQNPLPLYQYMHFSLHSCYLLKYNPYTHAYATSPFPSCHFGLRGPTAPREQQQASPLQLLHLCGMVAAEGFTNQPTTHPQVRSMTNSDPPSLVVTLITP